MRSIGAGMQAALDSGQTQLNICWALYRDRDKQNITGFSSAANALITTQYAHGLSVGDSVYLTDVGGVSSVHRKTYKVQTAPTSTTFTINYDSSLDAYTSGGVVRKAFGFTNSDVDFEYDNVDYNAASGMLPTRTEASVDMSVASLEIQTLLGDIISKEDIFGGVWDGTITEIFLVNSDNLADGDIRIMRGWVGKVRLNDEAAIFELRDLMQALQQRVGEVTTVYCRNQFGDTNCGIDTSLHDDTGTITSVTNDLVFVDSASTQADGYFTNGQILFTSGNNAGIWGEVLKFASDTFTLAYRMPYDVQVGDAYVAVAGCDKSFNVCLNTFSNTEKFKGEPHIPTANTVNKYGDFH